MTSVSQEDEFTEVTRKRKKRKASGSPTLPTLQRKGSSELPPETPIRPRPYPKNTIPVIISGVDPKLKNWGQLMSELRQYHPCLKVSNVKELSSIGVGGTSTVSNLMAPLTLFNEAPKCKSVAPLALKNAYLWLSWSSLMRGYEHSFTFYGSPCI